MSPLRRATAIAAVLSCLPLVPALAVAPVERSRVAAVTLELVDDAGATVRVALRVWDASAGDRVDARVETCDASGCSYPVFHTGDVDATAVELDATAAAGRATLSLGGRSVALAWQPAESSGAVVSAGDLQGSEEAVAGGMYVGSPALVRVDVDGASCSTSGAVGDGARLRLPEGSTGGTRSLEELHLLGSLGCATS